MSSGGLRNLSGQGTSTRTSSTDDAAPARARGSLVSVSVPRNSVAPPQQVGVMQRITGRVNRGSMPTQQSNLSAHGSRRYSVVHLGPGQPSLVRVASIDPKTNETVVDEVDVPHEIISCLANNMPRLLQLVSHWSNRTGEVALPQFERVMHTLGVRYTPSQLQRLFRVLDADANGRVSLQELLLLKNAIDNDITALPARPSLDDDVNDDFLLRSDANWNPKPVNREVVLKIDHVAKEKKSLSAFGFLAFAKPIFGAIWKAELRPHHVLDLESTWHQLTRGPPPVHAVMRVCRRPEHGAGFHVRLHLAPKRGPLQGERTRYMYQAGPVGSLDSFCSELHETLSSAAERTCAELSGLLTEVRQLDLKLQEVRLIQQVQSGDEEMSERLSQLKTLMIAYASDIEQQLISQTRYTRATLADPAELVGVPRITRFAEELLPEVGHRVWRRKVAKTATALFVLSLILNLGVLMGVGHDYFDNFETCEFHKFMCDTQPELWRCDAGRIHRIGSNSSCEQPPPFDRWELLVERECDPDIQKRSGGWGAPLPIYFFASVVLPIGLFRNNVHRTTINKCILWTPVVPLILLQCLIRAIILCSLVSTASDKQFARIQGVEAMMLVPQVGVFLLMDAMRHPTPTLRLCFAMLIGVRFLVSLLSRATYQYPAEAHPLIPPGGLRDALMGAGASTKQSAVGSIDWTITVMLTSSIISVIFWPGEMAVVRLRCDTKGYFTWRDQYIGAMHVRSHRRDLDAADKYLWLRSKIDSLKDQTQREVNKLKRRVRGTWNVPDPDRQGKGRGLHAPTQAVQAMARIRGERTGRSAADSEASRSVEVPPGTV